MRAFIKEILSTLLLTLALFLIIHFTLQSYVVEGTSMEGNLHNGQRLLVSKITYLFHPPERGDIIIFRFPQDEDIDYVKRIIGLPGDTVEIKEGKVYINAHPVDEPYINSSPTYTMSKQRVPEGNYFVLGDNRNYSSDSHYGWTLPRQNIIGKAWVSYWPTTEWGIVAHYPLAAQLKVGV